MALVWGSFTSGLLKWIYSWSHRIWTAEFHPGVLCATMVRMIAEESPAADLLARIPRRLEIAEAQHRSGNLVAAVMPIHYPRELLRAFHIHPIEVWGPPGIDPTSGVSHLQPYVCSLVRNALSFLEIGGMDVVDLLIVPHACDSLQGLGSVLLDFSVPRQPVFPFYLPRGEGGGVQDFLVQEIKSLAQNLEHLSGNSPSTDELMAAVRMEERADGLMGQLLGKRLQLAMTDGEFYRLVRAREFLPLEEFIQLATQALQQTGNADQKGIRLMISGIVPEPMAVLDVISEFGGVIAADDLASTGRRAYPIGTSDDPFMRMAERLLGGPPDWNKGSTIEDRLQFLMALAKERSIEGVVFYTVKFCEPELFDLPDLRAGLQDHNLPSIHIEVDLNDIPSSELFTQIETFLEMML